MKSYQPRSNESGFAGVGAILGLAIVFLGVYLLVAAFEGDPAYYGSVDVPSSQAPIDLDGGEVNIYFAADVDSDSLTVPEDLAYGIRTEDGEVLEISSRNGGAEDSDVGAAQLVGAVDVPEDGTYFVAAGSTTAGGVAEPQLAFGLSPGGAIKARFDEVVDELNGPTGIAVLVALGLLLVVPRIYRAYKRDKRKRNDEIMY